MPLHLDSLTWSDQLSDQACFRHCCMLQALEALRKLRTEKVQEAKEMRLKLEHLKTHKDNADSLKGERQEGQAKARALVAQIASLDDQLRSQDEVKLAAAHQFHADELHSCVPYMDGYARCWEHMRIVACCTSQAQSIEQE